MYIYIYIYIYTLYTHTYIENNIQKKKRQYEKKLHFLILETITMKDMSLLYCSFIQDDYYAAIIS